MRARGSRAYVFQAACQLLAGLLGVVIVVRGLLEGAQAPYLAVGALMTLLGAVRVREIVRGSREGRP